ncbi:hypothetical protein ABE488_09285 [Luteimonas sp. TWI662]|uniref:hypothetical protein n=1 Tax=Luteimonas sp. TWI662 TaxID=3136789 RepID=UPI003207A319
MSNAKPNLVMIEVEATPQLIREQLSAWADRNRDGLIGEPFPYAAGEFMRFEPGLAAALEVDPQNPVLIVHVTGGAPQGVVAFYSKDGLIQSLHLTGKQLVPLDDAPELDAPTGEGEPEPEIAPHADEVDAAG